MWSCKSYLLIKWGTSRSIGLSGWLFVLGCFVQSFVVCIVVVGLIVVVSICFYLWCKSFLLLLTCGGGLILDLLHR